MANGTCEPSWTGMPLRGATGGPPSSPRELGRYQIDIVALSETGLAEEGSTAEPKGGYTFFWRGKTKGEDRIHGVGLAFNTSLCRQLPDLPTQQRLRKGQHKPCRNYHPRSLSPALMTGLDGEPSPDTPSTHSRRGAADRSRRPGKEERRRLMLPAVPVSSHARTVPGPASLGSDSTATSVPMADGSNAEERVHRFRWTSTI